MDYISILRIMMTVDLTESQLRKSVSVCADYENGGFLDKFNNWDELSYYFKGLPQNKINRLYEFKFNDEAVKQYDCLTENGCCMFTELDDIYPKHLKQVLGVKSPPVLYAKGNLELLKTRCIGFTGARDISQKGERIARMCSKILAQNDITVVSGYAEGSDMAVHSEALRNGGNTIFVLVTGILNYKIHNSVDEEMTPQNHLFISRFKPKMHWWGNNALSRNEIIIGLSKAVVMTEAKPRSGTYSTGCRTLNYKMPLFAFKYENPPVTASFNDYFIERGAFPVMGTRQGVPNMSNILKAALS